MVQDVPENLPINLRKAMKEMDITAAELSRQSGVSLATLSRVLSGQVNPSFGNMVKISHILGISLDRLTGESTLRAVEPTSTPNPENNVTPHENATDILATFLVNKTDRSPNEIARALANAANGTWVDSWSDRLVDQGSVKKARPVMAMETEPGKVTVDMAFPHELIEEGSIVSLMSIVSAAATGSAAMVEDIRIPAALVRTYQMPSFGVNGLRDALNKFGRPLLSVTMRPMNGLSPRMYGKLVYETLKGGVDCTCDPTMMHNLPNNRWRQRFAMCYDAMLKASKDTNEFKTHMFNISAGTVEDMIERADMVKQMGGHIVMLDTANIGWSALASVVKWCDQNYIAVAAMGNRSLQSGMLSEQVIAKLLRFSGADIVSIGSPLRGSVSNRRHVKGIVSSLVDNNPEPNNEDGLYYAQPTCAFPSVMPACGGGHNPWHFARLIDAMGDDMIIQCGGNVMGHPWGAEAGATANRVAVETLVQARNEGQNISVNGRTILQRAAGHSEELKIALDTWQEGAFLFGVIPGGEHGSLDGKIENGGMKPHLVTTTDNEEE